MKGVLGLLAFLLGIVLAPIGIGFILIFGGICMMAESK